MSFGRKESEQCGGLTMWDYLHSYTCSPRSMQTPTPMHTSTSRPYTFRKGHPWCYPQGMAERTGRRGLFDHSQDRLELECVYQTVNRSIGLVVSLVISWICGICRGLSLQCMLLSLCRVVLLPLTRCVWAFFYIIRGPKWLYASVTQQRRLAHFSTTN